MRLNWGTGLATLDVDLIILGGVLRRLMVVIARKSRFKRGERGSAILKGTQGEKTM